MRWVFDDNRNKSGETETLAATRSGNAKEKRTCTVRGQTSDKPYLIERKRGERKLLVREPRALVGNETRWNGVVFREDNE